jgi:hypothetical protein
MSGQTLPATLDGLTPAQIAELTGQGTVYEPEFKRLTINRAGEDDNENMIPVGTYTLKTPEHGTIFAKSITIRPFVKRFQYRRYDPKGGEDHLGATTNRSRMAATFREEMWDEQGTLRCGRPKGYWGIKDTLPQEVQDLNDQISCFLIIWGMVTFHDAVSSTGEKLGDVGEVKFIWNTRGNAYQFMDKMFKTLTDKNEVMQSFPITLTTKREKKGDNTYYIPLGTLDFKVKRVWDAAADEPVLLEALEYVQRANTATYDKYLEALQDDKDAPIVDAVTGKVFDGEYTEIDFPDDEIDFPDDDIDDVGNDQTILDGG